MEAHENQPLFEIGKSYQSVKNRGEILTVLDMRHERKTLDDMEYNAYRYRCQNAKGAVYVIQEQALMGTVNQKPLSDTDRLDSPSEILPAATSDGPSEVAASTAIARIDTARQVLEKAETLPEIKAVADMAEAVIVWAKKARLGLHEQNKAAILKLEAERKAGEMLAKMAKNAGGRPEKNASNVGRVSEYGKALEESGLNRPMANRWQLESAVSEDVFAEWVATAQEKGREITSHGLQRLAKGKLDPALGASTNDDSDEWQTPAKYLDAAREVLGLIDLDPATTVEVNAKRVRADRFHTKEWDGLDQDWSGNVWLNPPFSQPLASRFADKLLGEYLEGNVKNAIMLQNASTDTTWFHKLAPHALVCFTRGRIAFEIDEQQFSQNRHGQVFLFFTHDKAKANLFREVFSDFGLIADFRQKPETHEGEW